MFGLDDWIANFSDGATVGLIVVVAVLLGLRHASDPDHLAAVSTLIASGRDRTKRSAARLGLTWGLGHATTLFAFGLPIVLFKSYLPEPVQEGAEASVGLVIMALAVWLLVRWRRGLFHIHVHAHGGGPHVHGHAHGGDVDHAHQITARSPLQAYGIGLVHGMGGSAGVGILLLATIHNRGVAVGALAVFALFTAVSMSIMSTTFGMTLSSGPMRRSFNRVAPALGTASLLFGLWYALGALTIAPYYF
jgi:high-affinity nickel permease